MSDLSRMRWCQTHQSVQFSAVAYRCQAAVILMDICGESAHNCEWVWVAVPEPLEET